MFLDHITQNILEEDTPIRCWLFKGRWPKKLFTPDDCTLQTIQDYSGARLHEHLAEETDQSAIDDILQVNYAGEKCVLSRNREELSSHQRPRELQHFAYQDPRYPFVLAEKDIFLEEIVGVTITTSSKILCGELLSNFQIPPAQSLFDDSIYDKTFMMVGNKNKARVVRDIMPLLVPSAEVLAMGKAQEQRILVESIDEGWDSSIPITKPRPQPDYTVGFQRMTFFTEQLNKLQLVGGDFLDPKFNSYFTATFYMYFPFLTCEVACSAGGSLHTADMQNIHSATIAVRGVVELFRLVKRDKEIDREILAFSISHNERWVRIFGHYASISVDTTRYYRHRITDFSLASRDGRDKWLAFQFTKNVYDLWAPTHLKRITSVIDSLPSGISFSIPALSNFAISDRGGKSRTGSRISMHEAKVLLSRVSPLEHLPQSRLI